MSSLITKQTKESIHHFEQQAGLRDAGHTPQKITTKETKYLRVVDALYKLKLQSEKIIKEREAACIRPVVPKEHPSLFPDTGVQRLIHFWFLHSLNWPKS